MEKEFTVICYQCNSTLQYNLDEIQEERLAGTLYKPVKLNPENPQKYYIKCPECDRFNEVRH